MFHHTRTPFRLTNIRNKRAPHQTNANALKTVWAQRSLPAIESTQGVGETLLFNFSLLPTPVKGDYTYTEEGSACANDAMTTP